MQEAGDYTLLQLVSTLSLTTGTLPLLQQQPEREAAPLLTDLRSCHAWVLNALAEALEESHNNHLARSVHFAIPACIIKSRSELERLFAT